MQKCIYYTARDLYLVNINEYKYVQIAGVFENVMTEHKCSKRVLTKSQINVKLESIVSRGAGIKIASCGTSCTISVNRIPAIVFFFLRSADHGVRPYT